jgi:hypothetical protein
MTTSAGGPSKWGSRAILAGSVPVMQAATAMAMPAAAPEQM